MVLLLHLLEKEHVSQMLLASKVTISYDSIPNAPAPLRDHLPMRATCEFHPTLHQDVHWNLPSSGEPQLLVCSGIVKPRSTSC